MGKRRFQRSVLATRNPRLMNRSPVRFLPRKAERRYSGLMPQEPPRNTRRLQSPLV